MNKLLIAASLALLLGACAKDEAAAPASADAAPASAAPAPVTEPAADAAAAAAPVGTGMPQACEDYLTRAKACFAKSGGDASAAAFQQGVDQTRTQWESITDKAALETACKSANDQFGQTAAMLKCE